MLGADVPLVIVDACPHSRAALAERLCPVWAGEVVALPVGREDAPQRAADLLTPFAGRARVLVRGDDPLAPDRPFGLNAVLEVLARGRVDLRPVLVSAVPLARLTPITAEQFAALGARAFGPPVSLPALLTALAEVARD
jgi:hypothetical protein